MSGAAILAAIRAEAEAEAAAIDAAARARAAAILDEARRSADARVAAAIADAAPRERAEAARAINAIRIELLHRRAERAARALDGAVEAAEAELRQLVGEGSELWRAARARLEAEALEAVGPGGRLRAVADPAVGEWLGAGGEGGAGGGSVAVGAVGAGAVGAGAVGAGQVGGGRAAVDPLDDGPVAVSADGRLEVDASPLARLARARIALAEALATDLGLEA